VVNSPPYRVLYGVNYYAPGFWWDFFRELDQAVRATGAPVMATSWHRSRLDNERVGGQVDSQHLIGTAVDLVTEKPTQLANELGGLGWVAINEGDHVHAQAWPAGIARSVGLLDALGL